MTAASDLSEQMLTFLESISLAGDRGKQNDDAAGLARGAAWIIDGATDLHDAPLTGFASDAAWLAQETNAQLHAHARATNEDGLRAEIAAAATSAAHCFSRFAKVAGDERWKLPIASLLIIAESASGIVAAELGDCRLFALDANGAAHALGGPPAAADNEARHAKDVAHEAALPLLERTRTMTMLRRGRALQNGHGGSWTFCLDPACAQHASTWRLALARPAHLLLATDGFAALVDRYNAYDSKTLMQATLSHGLQELGRELRAIETEDAAGARHPRFKRSDDATALLIRLE